MLISQYLGFINKIKKDVLRYKEAIGLSVTDPGFALEVRQSKHLVYEEYFGVKDQKTKAMINSDTIFLMASLAKPVLANFILENLNYFPHKYINEYLYSPYGKLTIGDLLRHKSGLPDYLFFLSKKKINEMNIDELVNAIFLQELNFQPGKKVEYSNSGYIILTKIIENIFKDNYSNVIWNFYSDLGIKFHFKNESNFASNYKNSGGIYKKIIHNRYITGWGDGLLYSSVSEYVKLFKDNLKYRQLLQSGYGKVGNFYYHIGGAPGVDSLFCYLEEMDLEIVLICNSTNNTVLLSDLVLDSIEGKPVMSKANDRGINKSF